MEWNGHAKDMRKRWGCQVPAVVVGWRGHAAKEQEQGQHSTRLADPTRTA